MRRLPDMDTIIGTELWLKKDRKKTYVVDDVNRVKNKVHLSPTHEGGGKTWKKMETLWKDYERSRAMVTGRNVGAVPESKPIVERKPVKEDEDEVMSEQEMAEWLNEA